jgi:hypothetical protein
MSRFRYCYVCSMVGAIIVACPADVKGGDERGTETYLQKEPIDPLAPGMILHPAALTILFVIAAVVVWFTMRDD